MFKSKHVETINEKWAKDSASFASSESDDLDPSEQSSSQAQPPESLSKLISDAPKILTVYAAGTQGFDCTNQLQIPIYHGTETSGQPEYVSIRAKKSSGNSLLQNANGEALIATAYKLIGEPHITRVSSNVTPADVKHGKGDPIVTISNKWYSKTVHLTKAADNQTLNWGFTKVEFGGKKRKVLALSTDDPKREEERYVAVLIRTKETRTPGSSRWDGGNGGQLILSANAAEFMDEPLIVATCLMMLKKEADRQKSAAAVVVS